MKKRTGLKVSMVLLILLAIALAAGFLWLLIREAKATVPDDNALIDDQIEELVDEHKQLSQEDGTVFVNNEIVIIANSYASGSDILSLADELDARIADAMPDYGIYRLQLGSRYDLDDLEELTESLYEDYWFVDSAYINPVLMMEEAVEGSEDALPKPSYPSKDPWNDASWDIDTPRDENWGAEAVRAPLAWAYMDELASVNVGLIDTMVNMSHEDLNIADAFYTQFDKDTGKWTTVSVNNSNFPADDHGSHVAGIMCAEWNTKGMSGLMGNKGNIYYSTAVEVDDGRIVSTYDTAFTFTRAICALLEKDVQAINISLNTNRLLCFAASYGNKDALAYLQSQADLAGAMLKRVIEQRQSQGKPDFVVCVAAGNVNNKKYYEDDSSLYGYSTSGSFGKKAMSGGTYAQYNNFLSLIDEPSVADRIIVVGAVGIDAANSTKRETRYRYSAFSNIGPRVDIVAPGEDIYSTTATGYDSYGGTSMATPHVTAAAGMVFAANPDLTGPEVKTILCASAYGQYYYQDGNSGLLDMGLAVHRAILTRESSVNRVVGNSSTNGLDLCFLVDTTGSMGDDIADAQSNMMMILDSLDALTGDYRVALVDYRDFPERTYDYADYAAKIQLDFSEDKDMIANAIYALDLGYGGDDDETVFSGFATALTLDWRQSSTKVIIVLGDASPLDPEPYTGYTYESIVQALYNADIAVDTDSSDDRVLGDGEDSLIKIYAIGTSASSDAEDFFQELAEDTGGAYTGVEDASQVSDAIVDSIEMIELEPTQSVQARFGSDFSGETVDIFEDGDYLFSVVLDSQGKASLESLSITEYDWQIDRLGSRGTMEIQQGEEKADISEDDPLWSHGLRVLWYRERTKSFLWIEAGLVALIVLLAVVLSIGTALDNRRIRKAAAKAAVPAAPEAPSEAPAQPSVRMQYCAFCGTQIRSDAGFCPECGAKLK